MALQDAMAGWWPSRYGADDQAGVLNEITPGRVLEAIGLVRQALDLNCKVYDLDNLYVGDSSFFVSSTAVNPTLTIIANSLRVADHIAGARRRRPAGARPPVTAHA